MNTNKIINTLKVIVFAAVLTIGVQYAAAQTTWSPPSATPPNGNTFAPLNVGSSGQVKDGGLTLNAASPGATFGLIVPYGKIGIGSGVNNPSLNSDANTSAVKFQLFGSGVQRAKIQSTDTSAARLDLQNQKTTSGANAWHLQAYQNTFQVTESGIANRMVFAAGGDIGMGTDAPRGQLHVDRSSAPADIRISAPEASNAALQLYWNNGSTPHTGWAILRDGGSKDLYINRDTVENTGTRTDLKISQSTGQITVAPDESDLSKVNFLINGRISIKGGNPQPNAVLTSDGTGGAATWVSGSPSDRNLKTNIKELGSDMLSKVLSLAGVSYNWKDKSDPETRIGFIAQDVEKVFPEVVYTNDKGVKSVDYDKLVAPLVEAVKNQQAQIDELKAEIKELKANK